MIGFNKEATLDCTGSEKVFTHIKILWKQLHFKALKYNLRSYLVFFFIYLGMLHSDSVLRISCIRSV